MTQAGLTTEQMMRAAPLAVYLWPNDRLHYPQALAAHLGRRDLIIRSLGWLRPESIYGLRPSEIVFDHACGHIDAYWSEGVIAARVMLRCRNIRVVGALGEVDGGGTTTNGT